MFRLAWPFPSLNGDTGKPSLECFSESYPVNKYDVNVEEALKELVAGGLKCSSSGVRVVDGVVVRYLALSYVFMLTWVTE